jgi:hypothetical protein
MKLSDHGTAESAPSHVDLDAIMAVLRDHPEALVECAMAFSIYRNPEQRGMRALERSANVAFHCVQETLAHEAWGLSPHGLIQTIERGKSWDSEGREVSIYRLAESVREGVTKYINPKNPGNPSRAWRPSKTLKGLEHKDDGDTFAHRFSLPEVWALLDPALDIWSRRKDQLGKEGWRVAMLTGLETLEMSAKEWAGLCGGVDRSKRLAKKLEAYGFGILTKTGKARATRYTLDWSQLLSEQAAEMFLMDQRTREGHLLVEHGQEQIRITQPLSAEEMRAREGERTAQALLAELDGTETPEYRADIELLAEVHRRATADDWGRWMEVEV